MGLSGIGYWTHNMGGFEHDADPELYVRWVQFGMFSPLAHVFGMDHPGYKEPWNYGEEALKIFKQYDQLRYRMIPYIYSAAFEQYKTGLPIMRALVLENQNDRNTYSVDDQYMFGESLMICPVTVKGAQTRIVYLPEGTWFDYWTGKAYAGRKYYNIVTPLDVLPIFVKAGGIIPMQDVVQYDNRQPWGTITFEIFPSGNTSFDLYEDDGLSEDYIDGNYSTTTISAQEWRDGLAFTIEKAKGNFPVLTRYYVLKVHIDKAPAQVSRNGAKKKMKPSEPSSFTQAKSAAWYYDEDAKILWIKDMKASDEEVSYQVSY